MTRPVMTRPVMTRPVMTRPVRRRRASALGLVSAWVLGAALGGGSGLADERPEARKISMPDALRRHVDELAGPALRGRGSPEDRAKAAAYVAERLTEMGLKPLPGQASLLVKHAAKDAEPELTNVCGWWPAPPAEAKDVGEYVLLTAHYDHLGEKDGAIYPGADDNASGVAVMLEAVRAFVDHERRVLRVRPAPRSLCVVAFDLEERQLKGSRRFVAEPPVPLEKCALFLTMDQMGRSLADLAPGTLFLMGAEHCAWLDEHLGKAPVHESIQKARLGIDFQPPTGYSDYVPFQERQIPFLFLSTGACGHYHQPQDTPERLDYERMGHHVAFVKDLVSVALSVPERPVWRAGAEPRLEEVAVVRKLVGAAVPRMQELGLQGPIPLAVSNFQTYLDGILSRGAVTPTERTVVRNTARQLFVQAVSLLN
jgi:hypothetical protein